ncbi:MAG TPA: CYCXC family (seleno)protein [Pyrinomonadaceae bacterium]|nr:CYCXC family (seleno)protein [Pyrinomonadaceae bacterium]
MKASKKINLTLACGLLFTAALTLQACGGASSEQAASSPARQTATPASGNRQASPPPQTAHVAPQAAHGTGATTAPAADDAHHGHSHGEPGRVPRFAATAADLKNLPPVLPASQFTGMTRMAYAAVKEIPETIAQLPCYCHCDEGFGHKSLQTCFVDDHAAHCAVCVEEALLAYKLQKQERLTPAQIRERIIAQYGQAQ